MAPVEVGGAVTRVATGSQHTCAILDPGALRCWGRNADGQLGYGHTNDTVEIYDAATGTLLATQTRS